jgi:hypothetical protein
MSKISHENLDALIRFIKTPAWKELKQAVADHKEKRAIDLLNRDLTDTQALAIEASRLKGFGECLQYIQTLIKLEGEKTQ